MIGSGECHISTVVSLAQSQLQDCGGTIHPMIRGFASLGNFGASPQNEERDLHKWLGNIHDINLEVYNVPFLLDASSSGLFSLPLLFQKVSNEKQFMGPRHAQAADSKNLEEVQIPMLLPHELLDAVWRAGPDQACV